MYKYLFVLLFFFLAQGVSAAEEYVVKIQPGPEEGIDTYFGIGSVGGRDGRPDANHLRIGGWGDEWFSFLKFDLSVVPSNAEVQNAKLNLYNTQTRGNINYGKVDRVTSFWEESDPSDSNIPLYESVGAEWQKVYDQGWWTVDVSSLAAGWLNVSYENYGVRVEGQYNNNDHVKGFYSSDYLDDPSLRPYLEVTYTLPEEEEEEVDPLVLQYAPVLALHPDEDYFPMDTLSFVEASALWDKAGTDTQVHDATDLTSELFETVVGAGDTSDLYLAFSDPDNAKSLDLIAAKAKYDVLGATTTVYYHRMGDGDYTVLQYWYFYAMNNWKEQGGLNNHEGDWESVFVYLDKETKEPKYVAYSAHHNDGDEAWNVAQYDSVRRDWSSDEVEVEGDTVTSYVALGSHANYPNHGDGAHRAGIKDDRTSTQGTALVSSDHLAGNALVSDTAFWMDYEGLWGADTELSFGGDGPQGPAFSTVGGSLRFASPVAWAGIDRIRSHFTQGGETTIDFQGTGVGMLFVEGLPAGEEIVVDPHDEHIFFGQVPEGVTLLPKFWDIESTLENLTFSVEVAFEYSAAQVEALGDTQGTLAVFYYNEAEEAWEAQESAVDENEETVSFTTDHFSRYALGFVEEAETAETLFADLKLAVEESELRNSLKRYLLKKIELAERFYFNDRRYAQRISDRMLHSIDRALNRFERLGRVSEETHTSAQEIIGKLQEL